MAREEAVLVPLMERFMTEEEQRRLMRVLYGKFPDEELPMMMAGVMGLLDQDEREGLLQSFLKAMPEANLKIAVSSAPNGMSAEDWEGLRKRVPELWRPTCSPITPYSLSRRKGGAVGKPQTPRGAKQGRTSPLCYNRLRFGEDLALCRLLTRLEPR